MKEIDLSIPEPGGKPATASKSDSASLEKGRKLYSARSRPWPGAAAVARSNLPVKVS